VLFTCEEERRLARDSFWLYRCTEQVVGFGTQEPPDAIERQRLAFLERFPKLRGRRLLLFLGRMHPKKGPDLVLEAFAALLRKAEHEPNQLPHLVMAGPDDSSYCLDLKSRVLSLGIVAHTTWTGLLEGDAKWGALRTADAFVLPSHQENFGIAVAEALACGVPVLISRQVNIWREVIAHQAGFVDDDDLPGTQRQLERWIAMDGDERAAFATRARNCFKQEFDLVRTARALNEMIAAASEGRADGARRAQTATADAVSSAR
jgi:glycosyltransferase involved in cell wall biosynthesis